LIFEFAMMMLPNRNRRCEQSATFRRQCNKAATSIGGIGSHLDKVPPFQRLERSRKRRTVHCKKFRDAPHSRRFFAVQGHEQGKLTISEIERSQRIIKVAGQRSRRTLCGQAQASIANV
jgi:hypothetical protein